MEIDLVAIIFQIINFLILMFLFKKFLFKPVLKILDERAQRIKDGLESAEKNIQLAQTQEQKKDRLIQQAKKEADKIIQDAKKQSIALIAQARLEAKKEADLVLVREKQALEASLESKQKDFESKAKELVIQGVEAVLKNAIDPKTQEQIIASQISKLKLSF